MAGAAVVRVMDADKNKRASIVAACYANAWIGGAAAFVFFCRTLDATPRETTAACEGYGARPGCADESVLDANAVREVGS